MAFFKIFGHKKKYLPEPSSVSLVIDESGEPQIKGYPPSALQFSDLEHRNYVLATAIVKEFVEKEGVKTDQINIDPKLILGPSIVGMLGNEKIHIYVRTATYPQIPALEPVVSQISSKGGIQAYFAPVGLMPADEEGFFFVNFRGCERLLG